MKRTGPRFPTPRSKHALKGWGAGGKPADAQSACKSGETLIRNVPTDIRSYGGEPFGKSIFVFEHGGLCIGHLGHLHHEPTEEQYAAHRAAGRGDGPGGWDVSRWSTAGMVATC